MLLSRHSSSPKHRHALLPTATECLLLVGRRVRAKKVQLAISELENTFVNFKKWKATTTNPNATVQSLVRQSTKLFSLRMRLRISPPLPTTNNLVNHPADFDCLCCAQQVSRIMIHKLD
jgi:hypothetical protein